MTAPLVVSSNLIVDEIRLADGSEKGVHPGGAALWAALGARYFWPKVAVLAGVGKDAESVFGPICSAFGLRREGHLLKATESIRSRLIYLAEDHRTEVPAFGTDHFARMQVRPSELPTALRPAAGTYIFRDLWPEFWADVGEMASELGPILWELQGDVARPDCLPGVRALLPRVTIFSCNRAEALTLTSAPSGRAALDVFLEAGVPVVAIREGAEGALVGTSGQLFRVHAAPGTVVDVTGGGNAFCGGLLAGWLTSRGDLEASARAAAAAAALMIAQFGAPLRFDPAEGTALAARVEIDDVT
jgi:sugar/nucleoside kinase (ribokinase family)